MRGKGDLQLAQNTLCGMSNMVTKMNLDREQQSLVRAQSAERGTTELLTTDKKTVRLDKAHTNNGSRVQYSTVTLNRSAFKSQESRRRRPRWRYLQGLCSTLRRRRRLRCKPVYSSSGRGLAL